LENQVPGSSRPEKAGPGFYGLYGLVFGLEFGNWVFPPFPKVGLFTIPVIGTRFLFRVNFRASGAYFPHLGHFHGFGSWTRGKKRETLLKISNSSPA